MESPADARDVGLGVLVMSARAGLAVGKLASTPMRVAARAPLVGGPVRRMTEDIAAEGRVARARVMAVADVERLVDAVLEDPRTERVLARALDNPGLERMVVRVLESRFLDDITERVLNSPEMQRVIEHIAASPEVMDAVAQHTQSMAEEMVTDVRRRTQRVDDVAEQTVRGWLRRPRPRMT
jgi:hypothetical protein